MSSSELNPAKAQELIDELCRRLTERGVSIRMYVVGGIAMSRNEDQYIVRNTEDVDAVYSTSNQKVLQEVVANMQREYGLKRNWFNDSAKPFLPHGVKTTGTGPVAYAEDEVLIAMKLAAAREQDLDDLAILAHKLKLTKAEQIVDISDRLWEEGSVHYDHDAREENLRLAVEVLQQKVPLRSQRVDHVVELRRNHCLLCGRPLAKPSESGMGPKCNRKLYSS